MGKYGTVFINVGVGRSNYELNITWASSSETDTAIVQIAKESDGFSDDSAIFNGSTIKADALYFNKVTVTQLEPDAKYLYRLGNGVDWSEAYTYRTKGDSDFGFLFTADAHIGAGDIIRDSTAWGDTVAKAVSAYPDVAFLLSAGDQANNGIHEQFCGFFKPEPLRGLPVAAMGGSNHDDVPDFAKYFYRPNLSASCGISDSGSNYYFTYNDALFVVLNTNAHDEDEHIKYVKDIVNRHKEYKWKLVMFHHSIFSCGPRASGYFVTLFRKSLPSLFTSLGIDAVFMGHDHGYVRTHIMNGNKPMYNQNTDEQGRIIDPKGVLYITANSPSGSKYYDIVSGDAPWVKVQSQLYRPSFSAVNISDKELTVTTHLADTMDILDCITICKKSVDK